MSSGTRWARLETPVVQQLLLGATPGDFTGSMRAALKRLNERGKLRRRAQSLLASLRRAAGNFGKRVWRWRWGCKGQARRNSPLLSGGCVTQVLPRWPADYFLATVVHDAAANFTYKRLRSFCRKAGLIFGITMRASDFAAIGAAHAHSRYSPHSTHSYMIETLPSVSAYR